MKVVHASLDNQRRVVTHFYSQMAVLWKQGELPSHVFGVWDASDLQIIPKVIVPLSGYMRKAVNKVGPLFEPDHALRAFYRAAYECATASMKQGLASTDEPKNELLAGIVENGAKLAGAIRQRIALENGQKPPAGTCSELGAS